MTFSDLGERFSANERARTVHDLCRHRFYPTITSASSVTGTTAAVGNRPWRMGGGRRVAVKRTGKVGGYGRNA